MASHVFSLRLFTASALVAAVSFASTSATAQANQRFAQIVVDADTNEVIFEENAQALRRPASITKVMTLYLLFDAIGFNPCFIQFIFWSSPLYLITQFHHGIV